MALLIIIQNQLDPFGLLTRISNRFVMIHSWAINHVIIVDINECVEDTDGCAHQCTNTIGSYFCTCNTGYSLDSDQHGCIGEFIISPSTFLCEHSLIFRYK